MQRSRVHITGASGSGTTTLARALADYWSVPHADADDYFWVPTSPPFVEKRPQDERLRLMHDVFVPREAWVLSGSMLGWGDSIVECCDAVVFLTLEPGERLRRLRAREGRRRVGQHVDEQAFAEFIDWARSYDDPSFDGRSRAAHEAWLADLGLPVLQLDSSLRREDLRDAVLTWEPRQPCGAAQTAPVQWTTWELCTLRRRWRTSSRFATAAPDGADAGLRVSAPSSGMSLHPGSAFLRHP